MQKKLLLMLTMLIVTRLGAQESNAIAGWQKVKNIITSKSAQVIYSILGITVGVGTIYFVMQGKKEAKQFALLLNQATVNEFRIAYDLQNANVSYKLNKHNNETEGICFSVDEFLSEENRTIIEKKLWRMARWGQLASWFMRSIKVKPIIENGHLNVDIDFIGEQNK